MNKDFKRAILATLALIASAVLITVSYMLGKVASPIVIIIIGELIFNFILIPSIIKYYYNLHGFEAPSLVKRYFPFYNVTIVMSPGMARLSLFSLIVIIVMFVASMNISIFAFLGERIFLNLVDYSGLIVSLVGFFHFIFVGLGLGGCCLKIKGLYKEFFIDDDAYEGKIKTVRSLLSTSKFLEVILFMLPVVRIIPALELQGKCSDLAKFDARFDFDYDPHDGEIEDDIYEYEE